MATVFRHKMNDPRGRSRTAARAKAVHNVPVRFVVENSWEMVMTLPTSDGKLLNITLDRHDIKSLKTALGVPRWSNQTDSGQNKLSPSDDRWMERSRTYPGIAEAMGSQWGKT